MKIIYSIFFLTIIISACNDQAKEKGAKKVINKEQTQVPNDWIFDKVSGKKLKFKNGKEFSTEIYELKYIGQVENGSKAPFLIFSGRDCDECDASITIYIHTPADGPLVSDYGQNRYGYPGVETDFEENTPLYKAQAFYGEVLPGVKGVVWYQNVLTENNTWEKSTFLVTLINGVKKEITIKGVEKQQLTLDLLNKKSCQEIKGIEYTSEP